MIPKITNRLIDKELKKAKAASLIVGVVSCDDMEVESYLHDYYGGTDSEKLLVEIGSTTKTFTGTLLAKLVVEGFISLDDSVCPYVPKFKKALTYEGQEMTFRHLATHTASLPKDDIQTIRQQIKQDATVKLNPFSQYDETNFEKFFLHFRPKRAFGTKWVYSNLGIALLGYVLTRVVDMSYEEAIQLHILEPLGMSDTHFVVPEEKMDRYVKTYTKRNKQIPPMEIGVFNPAGGLKSSILDMLKYLRFQMGLRETSESLATAMEITHEPQGVKAMKGYEGALTWMIDQPRWAPHPIIHHGGTTVGFHTYCGFMKGMDVGIIVVSTVQISFTRIIKMLVKHDGLINTNIAYSIFKHLSEKADGE